jgi:hypothetical protein
MAPVPWRAAINSACAALRDFLPDAKLVGSIRRPLDAEVALQWGGRPIGRRIDGVVEVTLPVGADPEQLVGVGAILGDTLADAVDRAGCTAIAGDAYFAKPGYGKNVMASVGFRGLLATNREDFLAWWCSHHSDLNLASPAGIIMAGYALLHRDDALTVAINTHAGFVDSGHIYESVYIDDIERWNASITPEMAKAALEDDDGWLSRDAVRVALLEVLR